jgi:hypothetical protein
VPSTLSAPPRQAATKELGNIHTMTPRVVTIDLRKSKPQPQQQNIEVKPTAVVKKVTIALS